ncbi:DUF924 family protein [Sphingomonas lenta]|uniref:DUF924 domain-containing protein n=1 Tax=Sphingomonas lenta TaxID=1141887 RepID=A0A2A2SK66_9SPHN|nr:DUF924 family protein [Sphingomonas lenta]PAX09615.1 hypothetical protein CKY28_02415 [Sphingomonas lenta]
MARDLRAGGSEVHEEATQVLDYWFALSSDEQFGKDAERDREIASRFGSLRERLLSTRAEGWRDDPDTLLAAIVALDQFSRNIHRGTARAYEADPLALELTLEAIGKGWEDSYPPERRVFLYMPLMHAEDAEMQRLSVDRFAASSDEESLKYAREHADVIKEYGRFPSRNAALGRESTPAEAEYLSRPDAGW